MTEPEFVVRSKRSSLQVRFVIGLLLISLVPLAVSATLVPTIAKGSQEVATNHVARLRERLIAAQSVYRDLIAAKKQLYREIARRVASGAAARKAPAAPRDAVVGLTPEVERTADLVQIRLVDPYDNTNHETPRTQPGLSEFEYRDLALREPIADTGWQVELVFAAELRLQEENRSLIEAIDMSAHADRIRTSLPRRYLVAFLTLVGGVVILVTAIGILSARRITRRIAQLVSSTRVIAGGDLSARVPLAGRDEIGQLASAFNVMVGDLEQNRQKIIYLQRIGAWQDVARKLAHEIKNPLTPIQLAVQQAVSSYKGDDDKFRRLLSDAEEIVGEEIANLRRLVDAFSALGRLPQVEAKPIDLAETLGDLTKDPVFLDQLDLRDPGSPVWVSADRLLLRRVLANLVENAMQAGESDGEPGRAVVTWTADTRTGMAVVTVDDEGPGVAQDARERIFEPYITSKETGTGLGLAISKKIALDHKGSLEVSEQPAPTGGARFYLRIPLAPGR